MHVRKNIESGFWFSLGFVSAILVMTAGCFYLTEVGLNLLKGDTEMAEDEKMTERCKEFEQCNKTPQAQDVNVPDTKRRSDIELATAATMVDNTLARGLSSSGLFAHLPTISDALEELRYSRLGQKRPCVGIDDFKEDCFALRAQIQETEKQTMLVFREHPVFNDPPSETIAQLYRRGNVDVGEMKANLKLAFRHLEDARMRLGKAIQAFDGGESCYKR